MHHSSIHRRHLLSAAGGLASLVVVPPLWAKTTPLRVECVVPGRRRDEFWQMATKAMQSAASTFAIDLTLSWGERDRAAILEMGAAAAARRPDYMVVVNEYRTALPIMETAASHQVPAVLGFAGFTPEDEAVKAARPEMTRSMIGDILVDNHVAGTAMATHLITAIREQGLNRNGRIQLLAVGAPAATRTAADRLAGLIKVAEQDGAVDVTDKAYLNWSRDAAFRWVSALLRRNPQISGIWCANDDMALGAADAAIAEGRRPGLDVLIVGMNWQREGLARIEKGELLASAGGHFLAGALTLATLRQWHDAGATGTFAKILVPALLNRSRLAAYQRRFVDGSWAAFDFRRLQTAGNALMVERLI